LCGAGVLRRHAAQSAPPAGSGIRADVVSLRRARRLRRVSRLAAPPAAPARVGEGPPRPPAPPRHGHVVPDAIADAGLAGDWGRVMDESAKLHDAIEAAGLPEVASYAVAMAYRVRFYMEMNAREAMHVIELRTAPQGHPSYRRICQAMHRLIGERHPAIAAAMTFVDHSVVALERLASPRGARD